jgi:hypothetical protein
MKARYDMIVTSAIDALLRYCFEKEVVHTRQMIAQTLDSNKKMPDTQSANYFQTLSSSSILAYLPFPFNPEPSGLSFSSSSSSSSLIACSGGG